MVWYINNNSPCALLLLSRYTALYYCAAVVLYTYIYDFETPKIVHTRATVYYYALCTFM